MSFTDTRNFVSPRAMVQVKALAAVASMKLGPSKHLAQSAGLSEGLRHRRSCQSDGPLNLSLLYLRVPRWLDPS